MKYIDAERLKAKLDVLYRKYQSKYMETRIPYTEGLIDALDLAEQAIDSLQQEQSEMDLEEEVKRYYSDNFAYISSDQPTLSILTNIARHFAEWGAGHLKR